jgi:hypothetical protein
MKKEFAPYELALRMKQLGFDEPCMGNYFHTKELQTYGGDISKIKNSEYGSVTAPTFSQAFRWFRDMYNIDFGIHAYSEMDFKTEEIIKKYTGRVDNWNTIWSIHDGTGLMMPEHYHFEASSYEEAELACLEKLIEIVEQKQK